MIALPLQLGSTEGKPLWDQEFQETLQFWLLMIAVICVPWMLLIKPFIIWTRMPSHSTRVPAHSRSHGSHSDDERDLDTPLNMED